MEQEENLCDEVERLMEFTYVGDRVSAGEGYEADEIAITRYWWVKFRWCCVLLYSRRFPPKLNGLFV